MLSFVFSYLLEQKGISPHIDTHSAFEDGIASLSLGSDLVMYFDLDADDVPQSPSSEAKEEGGIPKFHKNYTHHKHVVLKRRSLLLMSGEARYCWRHALHHRRTDKIDGELVKRQRRVSFTFRRVRRDPCSCVFSKYCDSQQHRAVSDTFLTHKREKQMKEVGKAATNSLAPTEEEEEHVHKVCSFLCFFH